MARTKAVKVPVTMRALVQRINRKLATEADPRTLKAARGSRAIERLGTYYIRDCMGAAELLDVDPEKFGRDLGVLRPGEVVEG